MDTSGLLSLEQALQTMLAQVSPLTATETVSIYQAAGRITATAVTSPLMCPRSTILRWTATPCAAMN